MARQFPDLWGDLTDTGRDCFVRGLHEASSRSPEDREQAVAEVIDSWYTAYRMRYLPPDDEPLTDEDEAEIRAGLEDIERGESLPLDDAMAEVRRSR